MNKRDLIDALRQKEYEDATIGLGDFVTKIESILLILILIGILSSKINFLILLIASVPTYFILRFLWQVPLANTLLAITCSILWGFLLSAISLFFINNSTCQAICFIIGLIIGIFYHRDYIKCLNRINIE